MPKPRKTDQARREEALDLAVAQAKVRLRLRYDADLADATGLSPSAFAARRRRGIYRGFGFSEAGRLARALHFSGREVCEILGVPYDTKGDE